jgi:hypothetical protein
MAQIGDPKPTKNKPIVTSKKPTTPAKAKSPIQVKPSGVTPKLATKAVNANDGNVQGVWHAWAPGAIKDYMKQGMSFQEARAEAQGDFGYDIDPVAKGPKLWSGYTWTPDETVEPEVSGYGKAPWTNYGGGGGGSSLPTPPPPMKIRTATGQRRSPYWSSEDSYLGGFEPRFVILGDSGQW